MTNDGIPRAPRGLSKPSQRMWQELHREYELTPDLSLLLRTALEAYDRMIQCEKELGDNLLVVDPSGRRRSNPLIEAAKTYRSQFMQAWRLLGVGSEPAKEVGRPPRGY